MSSSIPLNLETIITHTKIHILESNSVHNTCTHKSLQQIHFIRGTSISVEDIEVQLHINIYLPSAAKQAFEKASDSLHPLKQKI